MARVTHQRKERRWRNKYKGMSQGRGSEEGKAAALTQKQSMAAEEEERKKTLEWRKIVDKQRAKQRMTNKDRERGREKDEQKRG